MGHERLGPLGEAIAARFLEMRGARILERGYRHSGREVDIIAWDGRRLLIVEVKTRRGARRGPPGLAVTRTKRRHIRSVARAFLASRSAPSAPVRFDVIEIVLEPTGLDLTLRYLPGAFREE